MIYNKYPYSNKHDQNLDYILSELAKVTGAEEACQNVLTLCQDEYTKCTAQVEACEDVVTDCEDVLAECEDVKGDCDAVKLQCDNVKTSCDGVLDDCEDVLVDCQNVKSQCDSVKTDCDAAKDYCDSVETECRTLSDGCGVIYDSMDTLLDNFDGLLKADTVETSLIAGSPATGLYFVKGYYSIYDGGQGIWRVQSSQDSDFYNVQCSNNKYAHFIPLNNSCTIEQLGGKANDSSSTAKTANLNALNHALSYVGNVELGNRKYYMNGGTLSSKGNISNGQLYIYSTLVPAPYITFDNVEFLPVGTAYIDIQYKATFNNCIFDALNLSSGNSIISINNVTNPIIYNNCVFYGRAGATHAIYLAENKYATNITIDSCTFINFTQQELYLGGCAGQFHIANNNFQHTASDAYPNILCKQTVNSNYETTPLSHTDVFINGNIINRASYSGTAYCITIYTNTNSVRIRSAQVNRNVCFNISGTGSDWTYANLSKYPSDGDNIFHGTDGT